MRVKFLKTMKGSPDGKAVRKYLFGQEYELPDAFAEKMIKAGNVEATKASKSPSKDPESGPPENLDKGPEIEEKTPRKTIRRKKKK